MADKYQEALRRAYEQGRNTANQEGAHRMDLGFNQAVGALRQELDAKINANAAGVRRMIDHKASAAEKGIDQLAAIARSLGGSRSGEGGAPGTIRIEDIPGRRVPFVMLVDIPIGANTTSVREASVTISQEGPFVAVKRMATFCSAYEAQTTDPQSGATARFAGRSFGRYRPIHSAWDINDSQHNATSRTDEWWSFALSNFSAGDNMPTATLGMPSNMSSFRTMEFDGRINVINAGSSYPRQNISVPSSLWTPQINAPQDLGALDFFERGEVLTVSVQPNHVNNPPAGNVSGAEVFAPYAGAGATSWPFLDGQYDAHEGIATIGGQPIGTPAGPGVEPDVRFLTTDSVTRLPDGILTIGWEGYRIIQPVGPAI
jgi:hypothetical protein